MRSGHTAAVLWDVASRIYSICLIASMCNSRLAFSPYVHVVHPYSNIHIAASWKKFRFNSLHRSGFHLIDSRYLSLLATRQDLTQGQMTQRSIIVGIRRGEGRTRALFDYAGLMSLAGHEPKSDYSLNWTARSSAIQRWPRCQWYSSPTRRWPKSAEKPLYEVADDR